MADNGGMPNAIDYDRYDHVRPIRWTGDALELLDQRTLPFSVGYVACHTSDDVAEAIHALTVRGAPAIGIAAAWGTVLAARTIDAPRDRPRSTWHGRWRACVAHWVRLVRSGARCLNAKRARSKPRILRPIAAWARWVPA
jgi:hypothetical protein